MGFISDAEMEKLAPAAPGAKVISDEEMARLEASAAPKSPLMTAAAPGASAPQEEPDFFSHEGGGTVADRFTDAAGAVNSGMDAVSFGGYGALNRLFHDPLHIARGIDEYRQRHPDISQWTDAAASAPASLEREAASVASSALASPIRQTVQSLETAVPEAVGRLGRAIRSGVIGGGTAAAGRASSAALSGASAPDVAGAAIEAVPEGASVGAGMSAGASGLGMLGEAAMNTKGGRQRQLLESRGVTVGPETPGSGGVFDRELAGVPANSKGEAQAAYKGAKGILDLHVNDWSDKTDYSPRDYRRPVGEYAKEIESARPAFKEPVRDEVPPLPPRTPVPRPALPKRPVRDVSAAIPGAEGKLRAIEDEMAQEREIFGARKRDIDQKQASMPLRDVTHIKDAIESEMFDGETSPKAVPKLQRALDVLNRKADKDGRILMNERELNGLRRNTYGDTNIGKSDLRPGDQHLVRELAGDLNSEVQKGPYKDLNASYAKAKAKEAMERKWLGLKSRPGADRSADVERIARRESRADHANQMHEYEQQRVKLTEEHAQAKAKAAAERQAQIEERAKAKAAAKSKYADERAGYERQTSTRDAIERSAVEDFQSAKDRAREPREQLGLTEAIPKERRIDRHKLKRNLLDRAVKDTHTAGGPAPSDPEAMERFLDEHGREAWRYAELPELAAARNDLSFGLKVRGGDLLKKQDHGHSWIGSLLRNAAPIQGRYLFGPAMEAALQENPSLRLSPLFQAALAGRGEDR